MFAYRSSVQESLSETPARMMLGREVTLPVDIVYGEPNVNSHEVGGDNQPGYIEVLEERMWQIHDKARENMIKASDRQKRNYDIKANAPDFSVGDVVLSVNSTNRRNLSKKLRLR